MTSESLIQLKHSLAQSYPDFEARATSAWNEVLRELNTVADTIAKSGPDYVPIIDYNDLANVTGDKLARLKRRGTFVVRNVVPENEATQWRTGLKDWIAANPDAEGTPADNPQYFQIFYTKPQVAARAHPNVLNVQKWCNNLYTHSDEAEPVDLDAPLTYVDRFRMRQPGFAWGAHPPHMDGGAIERWRDPTFRKAFESVFRGEWRSHDPYHLKGRIGGTTSTEGQPNQASIFRTFQGWLAVSETGPGEGTLKVFPDILLSTAYIMLRPFFSPTVDSSHPEALAAKNWRYGERPQFTGRDGSKLISDLTSPVFHGVATAESAGASGGVRPFEFSPDTHPHLRLEDTMISVPRVHPGDMVFWQADVVHAVEKEHHGSGDSSVMYIPAVPKCPQNDEYVAKQARAFVEGRPPPDFPQGRTELDYAMHATKDDIESPLALKAMGLVA